MNKSLWDLYCFVQNPFNNSIELVSFELKTRPSVIQEYLGRYMYKGTPLNYLRLKSLSVSDLMAYFCDPSFLEAEPTLSQYKDVFEGLPLRPEPNTNFLFIDMGIDPERALSLLTAVEGLMRLGFKPDETHWLYDLLRKVQFPTDLSEVLIKLNEMHIDLNEQNLLFYQLMVDRPDRAAIFVDAMYKLTSNNIDFNKDGMWFYDTVINFILFKGTAEAVSQLVRRTIELKNIGVPFDTTTMFLYQAIVSESDRAPCLFDGVVLLHSAGILINHQTSFLYRALIETGARSLIYLIVDAWIALKELGFLIAGPDMLYRAMIQHPKHCELFVARIRILVDYQIERDDEYLFLYQRAVDPRCPEGLFEGIKQLNRDNFSLDSSTLFLYQTLASEPDFKKQFSANIPIFMKRLEEVELQGVSDWELVDRMMSYAGKLYKQYTWSQDELQLRQFILNFIELYKVIKKRNALSDSVDALSLIEGPREKNRATFTLERIFNQLAIHGRAHFSYELNEWNEYELHYRDEDSIERVVNLFLLLQTADLIHLELSDVCITQLGALLEEQRILARVSEVTLPAETEAAFEGDVGLILRRAIYYYTMHCDKSALLMPFYYDANLLFRGKVLTNGNALLIPEFDSLLFSLLLVGLVSHAMNQWPSLLSKETFQSFEALGEPKPLVRRINRRPQDISLAGGGELVRLEGITSTSQDGAICEIDYFKDMKYTLFYKNPPRLPPILSSESPLEKEQLLLPGQQVIYSKTKNEWVFGAQLISTPTAHDDYWPRHALRYCYRHYLSQDYKDDSDAIQLEKVIIARPNHGLAHTYRVLLLIDPVIEYFTRFAVDRGLMNFCVSITNQDRQLLKIAAVFSVSGRQSEVGFQDNEKMYEVYRLESAKNFLQYMCSFPEGILTDTQGADRACSLDFDKAICYMLNPAPEADLTHTQRIAYPCLLRFHEVIRYMSNPEYARKLNTGKQQEEIDYRNYLNAILSMAHKLDLVRCYEPAEYEQALLDYNSASFIKRGEEQLSSLHAMQMYVQNLIESHGDQLSSRKEGKVLRGVNRPHRPAFALASTNPKFLERHSSKIAPPVFKSWHGFDEEIEPIVPPRMSNL